MSGVVFHHIAEGIMAQNLKLSVMDAKDSTSVMLPDVKNGNLLAADYVLTHLGIRTDNGWNGLYAEGNPVWGKTELTQQGVQMERVKHYGQSHVPNVLGMGARDAVYMLESRGLKIVINGRGKVVEQSLEPGHFIKRGETCILKLK
jgi:cell division protein FtsI (penicillin-binding protein 3)